MTDISNDQRYMSRAIELAKKGLFSTDPNPMVGCVIVQNGEIIAEGWHESAGESHAEIMALENCQQSVVGATCYATLEPCSHHGKTSPCSDALIESDISRLVVAMEDPNPEVSGSGFKKLKAAGITVEVGLMADEAAELNPGFIKRMKTGLPWVTCKLGMSLDGRTAMASGESQWITCETSRKEIQLLRARSSAIITGSSTIMVDNPSMNAREDAFPENYPEHSGVVQPWRIIMDSNLLVDAKSKIFSLPGRVIWMTAQETDTSVNTDSLTQLKMDTDDNGKVCPSTVIKWLAEQGCNEVMIEAGATLSGAFIAADLVDRLVIYMAPKILGDDARGLLHISGIEKLSDAKQFNFLHSKPSGQDVCLTFERRKVEE